MTQLSVNVNKIAVLRNSRGGAEPDVVRAAQACLDAGAHGITVHPRPDRRHITAEDVLALSTLTRARGVEFNIEGNPFAPPREGYPGCCRCANRPARRRPPWCPMAMARSPPTTVSTSSAMPSACVRWWPN
jgi:pyridoxine 5'-phosphate synthase PdxJ